MAYISGLFSHEKANMLGMESTIASTNKTRGLSHQNGIIAFSQVDSSVKQASLAGSNMSISKANSHLVNVLA